MSSKRRSEVSADLYLVRGAGAAAQRCDTNARYGSVDLVEVVAATLKLGPGLALLDVCCGSGGQLARFSEFIGSHGHAVGIDRSHAAVRAANRRLPGAVVVGDAAWLPFREAAYDAIVCNFAIYYVDETDRAVREWHRVLRPGGRLVVSGPALDTNRELYDFHRRATGAFESDADRMALGFVDDRVAPLVTQVGFTDVDSSLVTNHVDFPTAGDFLDYWEATSLFARTPGASRAQGERLLVGDERGFRVTKRISVLSAVRSAAG